MGPRLDVNPVMFEAASFAFGAEIAGRVSRAGLGLLDGLAGSAAMAGSDAVGTGWASAYDDAAALTVGVTQDVANGCYQLAALLQQSGFNYGRAESWSTPGRVDAVPDRIAYASCSAALGVAPGAAGGSVPAPAGWWLIERAVGYVWPGAHQDKLRAAASAWSAAALSIGESTLYVQDALSCIAAQVSPEVDDAMTACRAMDQHLWDLVAAYRSMAGACSAFAAHVDTAHSEAEHELISLLEWSAGIQVAGGLLAFFTAGISEIPAQGAQAGRIAAAAAKVRAIIAALIEIADVLAQTITSAADRVLQVSRNLRGLLGARFSVATAEQVDNLPGVLTMAERLAQDQLLAVARAAKTPKMTMSRRQVEEKFDAHARVFGVTSPKGAAGYDEFTAAIRKFVDDPSTTRVVGTYRTTPAVLNFNTETKLIVIQLPDGSFLSGWRMTDVQLRYVLERRSLGGG